MSRLWDRADTVQAWLAFERRHARYRTANRRLAQVAGLAPGLRVLDLGAGTGGTARVMLPTLGPDGRVDCVEPAAAMRAAGAAQLRDPRVRWLARLDDAPGPYDRIVCGAALWQLPRPQATLTALAARLAPGGALCFNIPGAYLGEADAPGGGSDPWLVQGLTALAAPMAPARTRAPRPPAEASRWLQRLARAGLWPELHRHRQRLRQSALRDWLKLPPLTPRLPDARRAELVDQAFSAVDMASWRWEAWCSFVAWRPVQAVEPLPVFTTPSRLRRDGAARLPGAVPQMLVRSLLAAARRHAVQAGLVHADGLLAGPVQGPLWTHAPWLDWQARVAAAAELAALQQHVQQWPWWPALLGRPPRADRGTVLRWAPAGLAPTPPHRDADYIANAAGLWTVWIALHDTPLSLGPLAVQAGSLQGADDGPWCASALRAGDALVFAAGTRHRALSTLPPQGQRWSVDLRVSRA